MFSHFVFISLTIGTLCVFTSYAIEEPCTAIDYIPQYTSCDKTKNTRIKSYIRNPASTCNGNFNVNLQITVSCDCELSEYKAVSTGCDANNERQVVDYVTNSDCVRSATVVDALKAMAQNVTSGGTLCDCTPSDVGASYTDCNVTGGYFTMVSYWKNRCLDTGEVRLPSAVNIGCHTECISGQFLAPPYTKCQNCSSGSWSFQGESWHPPFNGLPSEFHPYCDGDGCAEWDSSTYSLSSGDQKGHNDVFSSIKFRVNVVTAPAIMRIRYRVSSEANADGFLVFTNDVRQYVASGDTGRWEIAEIDLQDSNTKCKWQFEITTPENFPQKVVCLDRSEITPYHPSKHFQTVNSPYVSQLIAPKTAIGCNRVDYEDSVIKGKIVIVMRGECSFITKIRNAQAAGAAAVIVVNSVDQPHLYMGGDANDISIPTGSIPRSPGETFLNAALNGVRVMVNISRINIHTGPVDIEMMYVKDQDTTVGQDRVWIRSIEITGTKYAAHHCHPCEPGFTNVAGSVSCSPCPRDHYANEWGTASPCIPCPEGHEAPVGATECTLKQACSIEDYTPKYTHCTKNGQGNYVKTLTYVPLDPPTCDLTKSTFKPPAPKEVPCGPCNVGAFRNASHRCQMCPLGTVPNPAADSCTPCQAGTYAKVRLQYDNFNAMDGELPPSWSERCFGCFGKGWDFIPMKAEDGYKTTQLVAGRGLVEHAFTILSHNITLVEDGSLRFEYYFMFSGVTDLSDVAHLTFRIDMTKGDDAGEKIVETYLALTTTASGAIARFSQDLTMGSYTLTWRYAKMKTTSAPVLFVIDSLEIDGDQDGGAETCTRCEAGFECPGRTHVASPCYPGSFSSEGAVVCERCPDGTVQRETRGTMCTYCGLQFVPNEKRSLCVLPPTCHTHIMLDELDDPEDAEQFNFGPIGTYSQLQISSNDTSTEQGISGNAFKSKATFSFDLCGGLQCNPRNGVTAGATLACLDIDGVGYNAGSNVEIENMYSDSEYESARTGVTFILTNGDDCPINHDVKLSTIIRMWCDPYETSLNKTVLPEVYVGSDSCQHTVTLYSPYACPMCSNSSFIRSVGDTCVQGFRLVQYFYNSSDMQPNCFGGVAKPPNGYEECPILDIAITKSNLVEVYIGVISAVVFVVSLLVGVVYLYYSKKNLYNLYSALSVQPPHNAPSEMVDMRETE